VKDPVLTARERGAAPEETARQRRESNRAAGFVLEDPDVLCAMEAGGLGVFVPAKIGKSGLEQSVLSLARLGKLRRAADGILRDTALKLQNGAFPASPLRSALRTPCGHCDFQAVCGHEPGRGERWERGLRFGDAVRILDERYPDPGSEIPQI
jgi:ATP-dependent helicase/DNAse subunit B